MSDPQVIRTIHGTGLYVRGQAETCDLDWLVDTGCSITILSDKLYFSIPSEDRPELSPHDKELVSADGTPLTILGEGIFNITVGQRTVPHTTVVAAISNDGLLGMDFLKTHEFPIG